MLNKSSNFGATAATQHKIASLSKLSTTLAHTNASLSIHNSINLGGSGGSSYLDHHHH